MLPVSPYPFLRIAFFVMAGIIFQLFTGGMSGGFEILISIFFIFIFFRVVTFKLKPVASGLLAYGFCFIAGSEISKSKADISDTHHFSNFEKVDSYIAVLDDEITVKQKTYSGKLRVQYIHTGNGWNKASGNVLAYFPDKEKKWKYGDKLVISGKPDKIPGSAIPGSFDYSKYLSYKNIRYQHFVSKEHVLFLVSDPPDKIWKFAFEVRQTMSDLLKSVLGEGQESAVASMIVLGIRQSIDQELTDAYSGSGAMHVLAVSGLHVGMIFGLIQMLLGWLTKNGGWKHLFYLTALSLIWTFGLITAFSPSVLRAVVMFSVIIIGQWVGRKGNLYNTLGLTAMLILLFDPFMLMNVGFQMSFLAVFGIAYLNPQLTSLYKGNNIAVKWLWEITCISLSAQLFTFPLALYYFNQFPTYFLLSNLWVIPLSSAILYIGIVFFASAFLVPLKLFTGLILKYSVYALNKSMYIVSYLPGSVQRTIYFEIWEILLLYCIIMAMLLLFYLKSRQWLYTAFLFALIFSSVRLYRNYSLYHVHRMMVGDMKGEPYVILWHAKHASLWLPAKTDPDSYYVKTQIVKPLLVNGVSEIKFDFLPEKTVMLTYKNVHLALCDTKNSRLPSVKADFMCLPGSTKYLKEYIRNTQIKRVILYRNKSKDILTDLVWDIGTKGIFTTDI